MLAQLRRCWFFAFEFTSLVVTNIQLNMLPAFHQGKTNSPVFLPKSKNSSVVVGTSRFEKFNWLVLLFGSFAVSSHPGTSPDRQISRQTKQRTQVLINQVLNCGFACYLGLNLLIGIVTSIRKRFQCCLNLGNLLRSRVKLANQCVRVGEKVSFSASPSKPCLQVSLHTAPSSYIPL